jgi:pimeloyl-ACP methyl ester carboxylesterase
MRCRRAQSQNGGYLVVIPSMPLNLAVLDPNAALGVIRDHPEISKWAVGGHSLGGAMAGQFVANHPDAVAGLVLWAAYSAADVSQTGTEAAVIYGTLDAGADKIGSRNSLALLPADTIVTAIAGGNHANFGSYTGQPNDPPATIPREQQQEEAVLATTAVLQQISETE